MNNNAELIKTLTKEADTYGKQAKAIECEARVHHEIAKLLRESKSHIVQSNSHH